MTTATKNHDDLMEYLDDVARRAFDDDLTVRGMRIDMEEHSGAVFFALAGDYGALYVQPDVAGLGFMSLLFYHMNDGEPHAFPKVPVAFTGDLAADVKLYAATIDAFSMSAPFVEFVRALTPSGNA